MTSVTRSVYFSIFALFGYANYAMAANEITFSGAVLDQACTVTVNGGSSTLELGETAKSDLSAKGSTGAPKSFVIKLGACPAAGAGVPTKANIKFSGETDGDPSYFKNKAATTPAPNVGVLLKQGETAVQVDDGNDDIALPSAGGDVDVAYTAQLVATNTGADKGNVVATVTYNVSYN